MSKKNLAPWHYSLDKSPTGPVDDATMRLLVGSGALSPETLVWREGMQEWRHIRATDLVTAIPAKAPKAAQTVETPVVPSVRLNPFRVSIGSLKAPYIAWLVLFSLNFAVTMFSAYHIYSYDYNYYIWLRLIVSILAAIPMLILFGRCWRLVQDGHAEINPREAVGLLFVPGFHLYWFFASFVGLANTLNAFRERHFPTAAGIRRASRANTLVYCIVALVNMLFSAYVYINGIYWPEYQALAIALVIIMLGYTILTMMVMSDFYLTSKEIIEEAA
jgi:hypothetical protein